ncbi:MAG TPA: DUF1269 domain-containing protein [Vicinamibacterales bacterium]|nr:DUF1269 domain-containing protein [Vicinamibacterales bacterium]
MRSQKVIRRIAATVAAAAITAIATGIPTLRAADKSETLIYAVYNGQDTASQVYKTMQQNQSSTGERIEAYAVVSKDLKGKVRIRDQRRRDSGIGAVVGGVIGLVGGPVGVAAGAAAGGAAGYLTGDAVGISRDNVESMKNALVEDSSALVVVLEDRWVKDVQRDMQQQQTREVIASQIANK